MAWVMWMMKLSVIPRCPPLTTKASVWHRRRLEIGRQQEQDDVINKFQAHPEKAISIPQFQVFPNYASTGISCLAFTRESGMFCQALWTDTRLLSKNMSTCLTAKMTNTPRTRLNAKCKQGHWVRTSAFCRNRGDPTHLKNGLKLVVRKVSRTWD